MNKKAYRKKAVSVSPLLSKVLKAILKTTDKHPMDGKIKGIPNTVPQSIELPKALVDKQAPGSESKNKYTYR